jgi:hypothetical protein
MAQETKNTSYPTSAAPTAMANRHAHGFRQLLAAVAEALSANPALTRRSATADRLRSAANSPTSGWA